MARRKAAVEGPILPRGEEDPDFVRALARGLNILECFENAADGLTLTGVAERAILTRGSARRLLLTLEFLGYIKSRGGRFFLQPRTMRLGYAYLASQPLWSLAQQYLEDLVNATGESCSIGVLENFEALYVARAVPNRLIQNNITVGTKLPAYANSMGKLLLSQLPPRVVADYINNVTLKKYTPHTINSKAELRRALAAIRRQGWALNDQEIEAGLQAVAMPLILGGGEIVGAINIARYISPGSDDKMARFLPIVRKAAAELSKLISLHPKAQSLSKPG
jgi:IclR family pca regulon transcriptional regulator